MPTEAERQKLFDEAAHKLLTNRGAEAGALPLPDPMTADKRTAPLSPFAVSRDERKRGRSSERRIGKLEAELEGLGEEVPEENVSPVNRFFDFLANLQRPQSALFNTVIELREGKTDVLELADAFAKGFTFEERATGIELLEAFNHDTTKLDTKINAFILDVVADPLIGIGKAAKVIGLTRYLKMGAKGVKSSRIVRELVEEAGKRRSVQALQQAFTNRTGNKLYDTVARKSITQKAYLQGQFGRRFHEFEQQFMRPLVKKDPKLQDRVPVLAEFLNRPKRYAQKLDEMRLDGVTKKQLDEATRAFDDLNKQIRTAEAVSGVATPSLGAGITKAIVTLDNKKRKVAQRAISKIALQAQRETAKLERRKAKLLAKIPETIQRRFIKTKNKLVPGADELTEMGVRLVNKGIGKNVRRIERDLNALRKQGKFFGSTREFRKLLDDFIVGKVDERGLRDNLGRFLGDSLSLRHLPALVAQVTNRRSALTKLADIQTNMPKLVKETTDVLLDGTYTADELIEIVGAEAPGLVTHIRNVGRRLSEVEKHVGDMDDLPRLAQETVEEFVKGNFSTSDVLEILGKPVKGARLGTALNELKRTVTAIDNLHHKVVPGRLMRVERMLDKRFGEKMRRLEAALDRVPNYVPHIAGRETVDQLIKHPLLVSRMFSDKTASLLRRKFIDGDGVPLTFEEIEAIVEKGELASLGGKPLLKPRGFLDILFNRPKEAAKFWATNPAVILATRGQRAAKAISGAEFLDNVKMFGRVLKAGERLGPGEAFSTAERLKGIAFPAELVPEIDRVFTSAFGNDKAVQGVARAINSALSYWKTWTLVAFPEYFNRNTWGDMWNMHLAGMFPDHNPFDGVEDLIKATKLQLWSSTGDVEKLRQITMNVDGHVVDGNELVRMFSQRGVLNEGFWSVDLARGITDVPGDDLLKFGRRVAAEPGKFLKKQVGIGGGFEESLLGTRGAITKTGALYGKALENQRRLALGIFLLRKGNQFDDVVENTTKFMFDYQDITKFEEGLRTVFPFYTWTRKNVPLQLEQLILQPQKFSKIEKTGRAVTSLSEDRPPTAREVPEWMKRASPVPIRREKDGSFSYFLLENWHPAADIDNFLSAQEAAQFTLNSLNPALQLGLEFATGEDVFTGRPLRGPDAIPREFLGIRMGPQLENVLRTLRLLSVIDALNPGGLTRKERPSDPAFARALKFLTGVKTFKAEPEREELRRTREREEQLSRLRSRARRTP